MLISVVAEDDYNVYQKFMNPSSTVVKTSEGDDGKRSYANVELIVTEVKAKISLMFVGGMMCLMYFLCHR